jgi:hypothetical protein
MAYATVADFTSFLAPDPVPANASRLLDRASEVVQELIIGALYATDADGNPTDPDLLAILRKAACIQAQYTLALADETGAMANVKQLTLADQTLIRGMSTTKGGSTPQISPNMLRVLRIAGLIPVYPIVWG